MIKYIIKSSDKLKICRDVMEPYAQSVGFVQIPFEQCMYHEYSPSDIVIIDYCWVYDNIEQIDYLINVHQQLVRKGIPCFFRLVDDNPTKYNNLDWRLLQYLMSGEYHIVAPYDIIYLGWLKPYVVPYHYDLTKEHPIRAEGRSDRIILSGLINKVFYPYRTDIALRYNPTKHHIDHLGHPGYSGRCWNDNGMVLGDDYLDTLAQYKFMLITADDGSEVLKFIECAEAGCVPIGLFPDSIKKLMKPWMVELLHEDTPDRLLSKIEVNFDHYVDKYEELAIEYRRIIKEYRSIDVIKKLYEDLRYKQV